MLNMTETFDAWKIEIEIMKIVNVFNECINSF